MAQKMTVERTVWIAAPRERVWQAVTTDSQMREWWGDYWEITSLQPGATLKFGDPSDLMTATIEVVDPPSEFTILWPPQPQYHDTKILTTFLLTEENGGTRVTVTETGFEALPADIRQKRFDSTATGYETVLASLKSHLESANP